jgi:hypothetical protein
VSAATSGPSATAQTKVSWQSIVFLFFYFFYLTLRRDYNNSSGHYVQNYMNGTRNWVTVIVLNRVHGSDVMLLKNILAFLTKNKAKMCKIW